MTLLHRARPVATLLSSLLAISTVAPVHAGAPAPVHPLAATRAALPDTSVLITPAPKGGVVGPTFRVWGLSSVTPTFAGVRCRLDTEPWVECSASPGHTFTNVANGPHVLTAVAYDIDGSEDPTPYTGSLTVDAVGPMGGPVLINDGASVVGRLTWHLSVPATDPSGVEAAVVATHPPNASGQIEGGSYLDWDAWAASGFTLAYWILAGATTAPGSKTIWVQWIDVYGNYGPAKSATVTYDPTAAPSSSWTIRHSRTPAAIGSTVYLLGQLTASDATRVASGPTTITIEGHPEWTWTSTASQANGPGVLASFITSQAGTYRAKFDFPGGDGVKAGASAIDIVVGPEFDQRPPDTWIGGLLPPKSNQLAYAFSSVRGTAFECAIDESRWEACSQEWVSPELDDGLHVISVRAVSPAGTRDPTPARVAETIPLAPAPAWVSAGGLERTRLKTVMVTTHATVPDADLVRISGSADLDPDGVLSTGLDITLGEGQSDVTTPWSLIDPATGGEPGDGAKLIVAQWRRADGSWTQPAGTTVILDTTPPVGTMTVANGDPFVGDDRPFVVVEADEPVAFGLSSMPAGAPGWSSGTMSDSAATILQVASVPDGTVAERTVTLSVSDGLGNLGPEVTAALTVDRSAPLATISLPVVAVGKRASSSSVPVILSGTTADTGIGVASTELQVATGGAGYISAVVSGTTAAKAVASVKPGTKVQARIRGVDGLGHVGAWQSAMTVKPVVNDDDASSIAYSRWSMTSMPGSLGGHVHRATRDGAKAVIRFTGRGFALVGPTGPRLGRVVVVVDGKRLGGVDLHAKSARTRVVVLSRSWSASTSHVVKLKADVGGSRGSVRLDAFIVLK